MNNNTKFLQQSINEAENNVAKARLQLVTTQEKNKEAQGHLDRIAQNKDRLAKSADSLQAASNDLYATGARLTFERARLKRSSKNMQDSLNELKTAQAELRAQVANSHKIVEFAAETNGMIELIEEAMRLGQPVDELLERGTAFIQNRKKN